MSKASERWWQLAADDLRVAELVLREGIYHQACFHAQQCVEKALKGVLVQSSDVAPPRTHSIADLLTVFLRDGSPTCGNRWRKPWTNITSPPDILMPCQDHFRKDCRARRMRKKLCCLPAE